MKYLFQFLGGNLLFFALLFAYDWRYRPPTIPGKESTFPSLLNRCVHADGYAIPLMIVFWLLCLGLVILATGPSRPKERDHL